MKLILASASPRRAELLRSAGVEFDVLAAVVDESVRPGEAPEEHDGNLVRHVAPHASRRNAAVDRAGRQTVIGDDGRAFANDVGS